MDCQDPNPISITTHRRSSLMYSLRRAFGLRSSSGNEPQAPRRSRHKGALATLSAAVVAMALVAPAGAGAVGFQSEGSFTDPAMTFPRAISVDPSSGNIYVAQVYAPGSFSDPGELLRFDAS